MKLKLILSAFKHKWLLLLGALAPLGLVVVIATGVIAQQPPRPPGPPDLPPPPVPPATPNVEFPDGLRLISELPIVAAGITLLLPADAKLDALLLAVSFPVEPPEGVTLKRLPLPHYLIIRGGERAVVSKTTGEFQISEDHQEKFQFLIDQLGSDRMHLIDREVYEEWWGPHRK